MDETNEASDQTTVCRIDLGCLRRGIERSLLDRDTCEGRISVSGVSDQMKVCDTTVKSGGVCTRRKRT